MSLYSLLVISVCLIINALFKKTCTFTPDPSVQQNQAETGSSVVFPFSFLPWVRPIFRLQGCSYVKAFLLNCTLKIAPYFLF